MVLSHIVLPSDAEVALAKASFFQLNQTGAVCRLVFGLPLISFVMGVKYWFVLEYGNPMEAVSNVAKDRLLFLDDSYPLIFRGRYPVKKTDIYGGEC